MLLVTRYDTWSFFPFSVFSRSAKLGKEGSRVSGVVMTRLWGRAADYPVRHIKFSFPFFKRRQGGGAEPCLARRNGRNSFIPKAREGGGNSPVGCCLLGDPRMGSSFSRLAKCFRERSRVSGTVMTRLLGCAADYLVRHIKFLFPFSKGGRVEGRSPASPVATGEILLSPKRGRGGRQQPSGQFPAGGPTHGVPLFYV